MNLFDLSTTNVVNSRFFSRQNVVWRRRRTPKGAVFTTREKFDFTSVNVLNNRGKNNQFSSAQLFMSLLNVLDHLDDYQNTAWELRSTVENKLLEHLSADLTVSTTVIAQIIMDTLKAFDTAAYVKYASYNPELISAKKLAAAIR